MPAGADSPPAGDRWDDKVARDLRLASPPTRGQRRLWWLAWAGSLLAALALAGAAHFAGRAARQAQVAHGLAALLPEGEGLALYRLRTQRFRSVWTWHYLAATAPRFPRGPLPDQKDYRVALVGGFVLAAPGVATLRMASDDGARLWVDGRLAIDTWGRHPRVEREARCRLAAGPHLVELHYHQIDGGQVLELEARDGEGRELGFAPLDPARLDTTRWQGLAERRDGLAHWRWAGLALAGVLALLPPAWWGVRRGRASWRLARRRWGQRGSREGAVLRWSLGGGLLGLLLVAWRGALLPGAWSWRSLILALLGGALLGWAVTAGRRRPGLRAAGDRLGAFYLRHEALIYPTLAFLACAGLFILQVLALRPEELRLIPDARFDAEWYRSILLHGYFQNLHDAGVFTDTGNVAWYPLLPLLAWPWSGLAGLSPQWATLVTAWLGALAAFHLLFRLGRRLFGPATARLAPLALAAWPASFFLLIAFPYGVAISLGMAYFLALLRGRYLLAGGLGFLLGLSYPTAILAGVLPVLVILPRLARARAPRPELTGLLLACGGLLAGWLAIYVHHWLAFDHFWLPLAAQAKWAREPGWPWLVLGESLGKFPLGNLENLAAAYLLGGLLIFGHRFHAALWALVLATVILPMATGSLLCNYRQYLMAWPFFLLLASSPRPAWLKLAYLWLGVFLGARVYLPLWLAIKLS